MASRATLEAIRDALAQHLTGRVGADGAIRDGCRSRRLESALLLVLLNKENTAPEVRAGLTRYLLAASSSSHGPMDSLLAASVHRRPDDRARTFMASFDHSTGARKKVLVQVLFGILGLVPDTADAGEIERWFPQERTPAGELMLTAIKVLRTGGDRDDHVNLLEELDRGSGKAIWEGYMLAHLMALHALHAIHPGHPLIARGVTAMSSSQNPDGGIPAMVGHDVFFTGLGGFFTGLGGRVLSTCEVSPQVISGMREYVSQHQAENGGWPYTERTRQTDVDTTSWCLALLRTAQDGKYLCQIIAAETYLEQIADPAGGFPTYLAGHRPEAEMTANAVMALAPPGRPLNHTLRKAIGFLLASQTSQGTWPENWATSEPHLICQAAQVLTAAPGTAARQAIDRACRRLITTQHPDGGWGIAPQNPSDPNSTAHAAALANHRPGERALLHRGTAWLAERQNTDGSYDGPSDQVGPRPFTYDFPVLTNLRVLSALSRAGQRTTEHGNRTVHRGRPC